MFRFHRTKTDSKAPPERENGSRASRVFLGGVSAGSVPTRWMTSQVRAFYEKRYKQPKRLPFGRFVFVFDVALVSVVGLLIGLILYATFRSFAPAISVKFESASFGVAIQTPIVAIIRAPNDASIHRNVRAYWKLPAGMEIVESSPKILPDRSVYLGSLMRNQETRLRLIVRTYRPLGDSASIGLQIQEGGFFDAREGYFSFEKKVETSGLVAEIPRELSTEYVVPRDGVLPIRVRNQTGEMIPSVEIRPTQSSSLMFERRSLGDLKPYEERIVYLPLGLLDRDPSISWALSASSYEVVSSTWSAKVMEWPNTPRIATAIDVDTQQQRNPRVRATIQDLGDASVIVVNPTVDPMIFESKSNEEFFFYVRSASSSERVALIPIGKIAHSSSRVLGPARLLFVPGPLSLQASIRYTSVAGDQIGAGPNPPEPGFETRYWMFFTVNQGRGSLKDIHVRASLPVGVKFTGATAVPDGGSVSVQNRTLDWKLSEGPLEQPSVMIGAEISISPSDQSRLPYPLISSIVGRARDGESGILIESDQGILTTEAVDR